MMEKARSSSDIPQLPCRRRPHAVDLLPLFEEDEEREGDEGIGEIDNDFDTVEIDDVIREARGGRMPAAATDGL